MILDKRVQKTKVTALVFVIFIHNGLIREAVILSKIVRKTLSCIAVYFICSSTNGLTLSKNSEDTVLTKMLLKIASFSPLNPQISTKNNNLCTEEPKGIPIEIQTQNILPIFKRDGSQQCEEDEGVSIKEMEKELKEIGVRVFKAVKGHLATGRGLSVCGSPTNNINIFYVSSKKKKQVFSKGFRSCIEE